MKCGALCNQSSSNAGACQAVDHATGEVLAYVLGRHEDAAFLQLKELLQPFGVQHFYTDGWGAYERHLDSDIHTIGKRYTHSY